MVYPTLPRKKQQEPIRENNVDPLAPFPNKKIQNPTTQDPNSKFHIEQIQNPNPQNIRKIYILRGSEMVYPTLPRKKQQEPIRENNVDPLAPFPNKKIQNPTTQDPNSKFHIEQIQNPNPQNIQKIYILRGSEMVYPTLPRKKQQEPIRENNVDPLAPFPNKKIQNPTTQDPSSKFHIEQIQNPNPQNIQKIYILRGSEMVYPTLPRKKQQEPIRENNVDPLAPFPNKKIQNPTTQDPNSKFHIEQIQNPNPQNIQKIYILRGSEMVYPTLPRKKQQEPIRENNVDPLAPFPNKKIQNPTTQDPNSKFHIEQIQNPNPQNIQKIYILRGSEMVYPTLPRKKQQEPIRENNVDPLAPFPNKKIQNPTTQDPNSKFHIEQIQNPNPQNIQKIYILRGSEMVYPTLPRKKQQEPIRENNVDPLAPFPNGTKKTKLFQYKTQRVKSCKIQIPKYKNPRSKVHNPNVKIWIPRSTNSNMFHPLTLVSLEGLEWCSPKWINITKLIRRTKKTSPHPKESSGHQFLASSLKKPHRASPQSSHLTRP